MSKIGLFSDAHGNPMGLEACIAALRAKGAEALYFLGDAVGYLPLAEEVLDVLARERAQCQLGNHEAMLCGLLPLDPVKDETYRLRELATRMSGQRKAEIARWPRRRELTVGKLRLLMVHGSPAEELTGYVYPNTDVSDYARLACDVVLLAQTHVPFARNAGAVRVINIGSCGLPRDGTTDASCALLDSETGEVELLRVEFDVQALLRRAQERAAVPASVQRLLLRTAA